MIGSEEEIAVKGVGCGGKIRKKEKKKIGKIRICIGGKCLVGFENVL